MKIRFPWLLIYVLANIVACFLMLNTGELVGDVAGFELYSTEALLWATLLVVLSYLIILGPLFYFISRVKVTRIKFGPKEVFAGDRIGKLLIIFQIFFIFFNIVNGVNIAGSNFRTDSLFSAFWVLVPIDSLFVIYYGMYRENRYFYPNLTIWLVSNLIRGWAGIFLFVIYFEWCRYARKNNISVFKVILAICFTVGVYPLLTTLKWTIRYAGRHKFSFSELVMDFFNRLSSQSYMSFISDGIYHIIIRLQTTSMVVEVMRLKELLRTEFLNGQFTPFWMEGLHGIVYDRLFFSEKSLTIGVAFTKYGNFNWQFNIGDWNTNIGYIGWCFIAPSFMPFYLLYTLLLGFLSFYLVKKIGISTSAVDMLWLIWLTYMMPPWHGMMVGFIYALAVFLIIKIFMVLLPSFIPARKIWALIKLQNSWSVKN